MRLEVDPEFQPKFSIGQKVWFIKDTGKEYGSGVVSYVVFILHEEAGGLQCRGYFLKLDNPEWVTIDGFGSWKLFDELDADGVYESEDEVRKLVEFHPVAGISEQEWVKAIGNRDDDGSMDQCDLPPCCGNISQARDILIYCQKEGGLVEREVRFLERIIKNSHPELLEREWSPQSILGKILKQLGINCGKT